jgi:hypothetical protein
MDSKYIPPPKISDEDVATVQRSTNYVRALFEAIEKRYGEDASRKIFAPYGPLGDRERGHRQNAKILWELLSAEKPNIAALARKRAGKRGNPESEDKQIDRLKKHPKILAIVEEMAFDFFNYPVLDRKTDDPFRRFAKFIEVLNQVRSDSADE